MRFATEADLKTVPRLRWQLDEDLSVVATPKQNPYRRDKLYFHGSGLLGIYYTAETRVGATARVKRYRQMLGDRIVRVQDGDVDGLIIFRAESEGDIPELFMRSAAMAARMRATREKNRMGEGATALERAEVA